MKYLCLTTDTYYFKLVTCKLAGSYIATPKRTNWESYREDLKTRLGFVPRVMHTVRDIELATGMLQQAILRSYHQNWPLRVAVSPRKIPYWEKRGEPP